MTKYFGTDGVRGKANVSLDSMMAYKIGRYLGYHFSKERKGKIIIGKDTRISSDMFELSIASGAMASGADVYFVGYCPTPAISYLLASEDFDCGVMISASHNPYFDNGIKLFDKNGKKAEESFLLNVESYMDDHIQIEYATDSKIGNSIDYKDGLKKYKEYLKKITLIDLSSLKILCDCANGSATTTALSVLKDLNANVTVMHHTPDGVNINTECGSTHPQSLQKAVVEGKYDVGFAFDGDADRLIAVNHLGDLVDGDHILYICAKQFASENKLNKNTVVTTVMANIGLYKALDDLGILYAQTAVGDKYVYECMQENDYVLGGEQSGHIIFSKYASTGDGLLTALMLLKVMCDHNKSLYQLSEDLFIYPQLLVNTKVKDKKAVLENNEIKGLISTIEKELGEEGRILVRPSGTEPLLRVMVEAKEDALCHKYVYQVIDKMNELKL